MKYLKGFNWIGIQHTDFKKETRTSSKSKFHDEISTVKSRIKEIYLGTLLQTSISHLVYLVDFTGSHRLLKNDRVGLWIPTKPGKRQFGHS